MSRAALGAFVIFGHKSWRNNVAGTISVTVGSCDLAETGGELGSRSHPDFRRPADSASYHRTWSGMLVHNLASIVMVKPTRSCDRLTRITDFAHQYANRLHALDILVPRAGETDPLVDNVPFAGVE